MASEPLAKSLSHRANDSLRIAIVIPLHTLANLFLEIVQRPRSPEIPSNLAQLDVLAGFFARIDFATDWGFCADFARELARLARLHVQTGSVAVNNITQHTPESMFDWPNNSLDDTVSILPFCKRVLKSDGTFSCLICHLSMISMSGAASLNLATTSTSPLSRRHRRVSCSTPPYASSP